jgi:hypothetical protein
MTTKTNPAVTTELTPVEALAAPAVEPQVPNSLHIVKLVPFALAEAAIHLRNGMVFSSTLPFEYFGHTGMVSFYLEKGHPDPSYIAIAAQSSRSALEMEAAIYTRQVEEAAARIVAEREKAAAQAEIAAEIEAAETALRALKRKAVKAQ